MSTPLPVFDCSALFDALDEQRLEIGLSRYELADDLWQQSSDLNEQRSGDHPLGQTSCGHWAARLRG
jgi:hypothetical protein